MVLNACRYFGHTRDYWWANLTWDLYEEMEWQLAENPPADRLAALYLTAQKMWERPTRTAFAGGAVASEEAEEWESPFPAVTE